MNSLDNITKSFVEQSQIILEDNLVGIYLHGSAAMGCFHAEKSDIDLLAVVKQDIPNNIKRRYMDMVVELNTSAPKKGIELSIVREDVCKPFVYPTPFVLHFSNAHLDWYQTNPADYIAKMKGTDKDLAAHVTILYHRGKCLCGKEIQDVFEKVRPAYYFDSVWCDVEAAEEEIIKNPMYIILNLCRVLAYGEETLILSKQEGGQWGLNHVPETYHPLILQALHEYAGNEPVKPEGEYARRYAAYMINRIKNCSCYFFE